MTGPLTGKRVLVTRNRKQAQPFAEYLKKEGAEPIIVPLLAFKRRESLENYNLLLKLHEFSWLFFTSANGVKFFFDLLAHWNLEKERSTSFQVASVGRKTAQALKKFGILPDFQPTNFNGTSMAKEFLADHSDPGPILLVEGSLARKDISRELSRQQVLFQEAVVYDTLMDEQEKETLNDHLKKDDIDIYTFTSPSTVEAFEKLGEDSAGPKESVKQNRLCVCIGETTSDAAQRAGFQQVIIPEESTIEGMAEAMKKYANRKG